MATKVYYGGFRFRKSRGGTVNKQAALSMRGMGGVRLHIGDGRYAMMSEADASLSVRERAELVKARRPVELSQIELKGRNRLDRKLDKLRQADRVGAPQLERPEMIEHPELCLEL